MVGAVFVFFCLHAQLWNFCGFVAPLSLKTPLKEYSSARARQVRRTVEFSGKLHGQVDHESSAIDAGPGLDIIVPNQRQEFERVVAVLH